MVPRSPTLCLPFLLLLPFVTGTGGRQLHHSAVNPVTSLVIGGNLTLNGKSTNIAQFDTSSKTWYSRFDPQLYLYGAATGEVFDLVVDPGGGESGYDYLYVVGAFDTVCKTCQQQYCSVGLWTGATFEKVGDGLCPHSQDISMRLMTAELAENGNFFVGGTFQSRVWSGERFVSIYNVAMYDTRKDAWLPLQQLQGGGLGCNWCTVDVMSLAWNERDKVLYIGGKFNMIDNMYIQPGLAVWSKETGILAFPGGGVSYNAPTKEGSIDYIYDGVATSLLYDDKSRSLYVAGSFDRINGRECNSIAVWRLDWQQWTCLYEPRHSFSLITSLEYTEETLFVAGLPSNLSSWANEPERAYTIARMSQSPALFRGKYDKWGMGAAGGKVGGGKGGRSLFSQEEDSGYDSGYGGQEEKHRAWYPPGQGRGRGWWGPESKGTASGGVQLGRTWRPERVAGLMNETAWEAHKRRSSSSSRMRRSRGKEQVGEARHEQEKRGGQYRTRHLGRDRGQTTSTTSSSSSSGRRGSEGSDRAANSKEDEVPGTSGRNASRQVSPGFDGNYRFYWEWLPSFNGLEARINSVEGGTGAFANTLFIGGEFDPPLVIWTDDAEWGPSTSLLGHEAELQGVVTSISQMLQEPRDLAQSSDSASRRHSAGTRGNGQEGQEGLSFTWAVVLTCVSLGICLGVCMAFVCHNQQYLDVPWLKDMVEGRNGISLTTLAGSQGLMADMEHEFRQRYDRAMAARHLSEDRPLNVINPKEIVLHKIIGEGSFGRVWSGMWRSSQVAVKEFVFAQAAVEGSSLHREALIEEIVGEAAVMSFLRHPRVLHLYGCSLTSQAIWIVSELCSRGSLRQVLNDRSCHLGARARLKVAIQVAEGMLYLHTRDQPIIHRDLKSHNVFMQEEPDGTLVPKIGDWGSARAVALHSGGGTMTHGVGTACWLAPEAIKHAKGSKHSDVYAFGIMLWEVATREEVHAQLSAAQIIARVANEGLRPKVPKGCPWRDMMVRCWSEDPESRPPFSEVVEALRGVLDKMNEIMLARMGTATTTTTSSSSGSNQNALSLESSSKTRTHEHLARSEGGQPRQAVGEAVPGGLVRDDSTGQSLEWYKGLSGGSAGSMWAYGESGNGARDDEEEKEQEREQEQEQEQKAGGGSAAGTAGDTERRRTMRSDRARRTGWSEDTLSPHRRQSRSPSPREDGIKAEHERGEESEELLVGEDILAGVREGGGEHVSAAGGEEATETSGLLEGREGTAARRATTYGGKEEREETEPTHSGS